LADLLSASGSATVPEAGVASSLSRLATGLISPSEASPERDNPERDKVDKEFFALLGGVLTGELPFTFRYQPIGDLQRGATVGFEGLVRFPGNLPLTPDLWFLRAEQVGKRLELEARVTGEIIQHRKLLPPNTFLSVNVSPSFLLSPLWDAILARAGNLRRIVVEITEHESVNDYGPLLDKISRIREAGGSLAVDDAGSGYASLHHIMQLKPEFVKLDRVFTTGCHADPAKSALIEMVGLAASRLDAWIIAEGVETESELGELISLKVPLAQGYYLARPQLDMEPMGPEPAAAIVKRVRNLRSAKTVSHSLEDCPEAIDEISARHMLSRNPQMQSVIVTDKWGGPTALFERHPLLGIRDVPSLMRVQRTTDVAETLQRALTRSAAIRYDPVIVIDQLGKFAGLARIDRLVRFALHDG
jgi:EAL domain-containing protein (putative c-di-GMP-specific phosphodiesterase class I)